MKLNMHLFFPFIYSSSQFHSPLGVMFLVCNVSLDLCLAGNCSSCFLCNEF
jgi:hypothetical protein